MLLRYFGYWLRLALGLFVLFVLAILAGYLGFFGGALQSWLQKTEVGLQAFYQGDNKARIDRAAAWIAGGVSAFIAVLTVYRPYYYAEFNLPYRITDYVRRAIRKVIEDREPLIAGFFGKSTLQEFSGPWINKDVSNKLWSSLRLTHPQRAIRKLAVPEEVLDGEIEVLGVRKKFCETQRITAHLVRGLQLATEAAVNSLNDEARLKLREKGLEEFEKALKLDPNDLDALQQMAWLLRVLKNEGSAIKHLERLALAAQMENKAVRQARAMRFHAVMLDERENRRSWNQARAILVAAIDVLERTEERGADRDLELALANELFGAIQIKREKFSAAQQALANAKSIYEEIPPPAGPAGKSRVEALVAQITQEKDEPDEPGDSLIHVNIEQMPVYEKAGGNSASQQLAPLTAVTVIRSEGGWSLIAKDEKELGYVADSKLHKLN